MCCRAWARAPVRVPASSRGRRALHAVGAGAADQGPRRRTSHTTSAAPPARGRGPERGAHWLREPSPRPGPGLERRRRDPPGARAAPGTRALGVARRRRHFLQARVGGSRAPRTARCAVLQGCGAFPPGKLLSGYDLITCDQACPVWAGFTEPFLDVTLFLSCPAFALCRVSSSLF